MCPTSDYRALTRNSQNASNDVAEVNSLIEEGGSIELPDAGSCEEGLGTDPDPWAKWQCMVAQQMSDVPDGLWAQKLKEANADISSQNYNAESIGWWTPTRQIKTFHPRTPGMHAYRDSIIDAINKVNANDQESSGSEDPADRAPISGSDPVCHSADDFPNHRAVDPGLVPTLAEDACGTIGGKFLQFDTSPDKWYEEREVDGVLYQYRVSWIEDCGSTRMKIPDTTSGEEGYPTCQGLFDMAFKGCNNGGVGGYVDADCARFTFTGGLQAGGSA
jgi:hypothetical protein